MADDNVTSIDSRQPHVVLTGNLLSGFRVIGPFPTLTALRKWTEANCKDEWWGAPLVRPEDWR